MIVNFHSEKIYREKKGECRKADLASAYFSHSREDTQDCLLIFPIRTDFSGYCDFLEQF